MLSSLRACLLRPVAGKSKEQVRNARASQAGLSRITNRPAPEVGFVRQLPCYAHEPSRAIDTLSGGARSAEALDWSAEEAVIFYCTFSNQTPQYQVIVYSCLARVYKSSKQLTIATFLPADHIAHLSLPHSNLFRNRPVSVSPPRIEPCIGRSSFEPGGVGCMEKHRVGANRYDGRPR